MVKLTNILTGVALTGLVALTGCDPEKTTIEKPTASIPNQATGVSIGDIDGDGRNDIVIVSPYTEGNRTNTGVYILLNKGYGNYTSQDVIIKPEKEGQ